MTRIRTDTDTATEPGRTYAYFLGTGIPQGTQQVWIDRNQGTTTLHGVAATWTGAADTEVVDNDGLSNDRANPSVTMNKLGRPAVSVAIDYTGTAAPGTAGTGTTILHTNDFTAFGSAAVRETTPGTSDFAISVTHASDDCAFSAFCFDEVAGLTLPPPPTIVNTAVDRSYSW